MKGPFVSHVFVHRSLSLWLERLSAGCSGRKWHCVFSARFLLFADSCQGARRAALPVAARARRARGRTGLSPGGSGGISTAPLWPFTTLVGWEEGRRPYPSPKGRDDVTGGRSFWAPCPPPSSTFPDMTAEMLSVFLTPSSYFLVLWQRSWDAQLALPGPALSPSWSQPDYSLFAQV